MKCKHNKNKEDCGFCKTYENTQELIKKDLLLDD